ncbi:type I polyketide synthase [Mycobacterium pseudoshottsii]|uniref:Phthiocerol/phenolphthiocerol synthesis polyketide synthase type I PpsB n=3 Tax=Mycobacterium pseudoshottsii TaxID=265949 RepID=A0A9N7QPE2_9MYCO|nr:type I polyketide synthase [Mycobacterium pseudoshottsii]BDN83810.1 phthiocerol/phenolphthiocerol synthesis polyketide synthase type I PpsB [Mycobacterium pseudoshottsii]BEH78196.1 phthiocerol/phenolphthiocerol synthesis polyketide synthase type I PpsB [Mycobacterium pseudoshottsii]
MRSVYSRISSMTAQQRAALSEEFSRASRTTTAEPVAVVGIGCRFPGNVTGPDSFWDLLVEGGNAISGIPAERWDADDYYHPDPLTPGHMTTKWGAFVADIAGFDAEFFGITPREAASMDPQQRMLLEVTWEALEHAGIPTESLAGTRTAVMMGVYFNEYQSMLASSRENVDAYTGTGNSHSITAGRISYLLGLRGPAAAIDTACSSSLSAIHLACQSLRLRETDLALAGGVSATLRPETQIAISAWGLLSPEGRCATFDAAADGFVRGEGAGVVVLKRLTDALRDQNQILAVVRGSAVNQDGRSNGITAPNTAAQCDVIADALRSADVAPESVHYVETHGTGTQLGDPIEFEALAATYGLIKGQDGDSCALGAVKTNIGHLEAASGVAGFIKAVLAVQHGQIPPNLHFSQWNPAIDAASTRLFVPLDNIAWPSDSGPRRAAVSSFGLGGTNAHAIVEQGPELSPAGRRGTDDEVTTLVVAGKTPARVAATAGMLADWMEGPGAEVALADVAHTLNHHRSRQARFGTVVARERAQAVAGLRALAANQHAPGVVNPADAPPEPGTVFVYSGRGSQWAGMGRQLLADEPAFAAAVAELEPVFLAEAGFSLHDVLANGTELVGIEQIQLGLIGMQLTLTELWRSYGIQPDLVIGHSMGEVAAAVVAGALTPAEGLRVTAVRSRLMAPLSGQGGMALLELDASQTEALIADYPQVTLGIYNSPRQTVISGPTDQIDELITVVRARDRFATRVNIEVAPHNPAMDALQPQMRSELADLAPRTPTIPIISTTYADLGAARESGPTFDAEHWAINMRNPVHFQQAITAAATDKHNFIEISAHPLLTQAILETLHTVQPGSKYTSLGTLQRDSDDTIVFRTNLNTVRTAPPQTPHPPEPHPQIPTTPWHHTHHWIDNAASSSPALSRSESRDGTGAALDTRWSPESGSLLDEWSHKVVWAAQSLPDTPSAQTAVHGRWLVLGNADLAAELGRGADVLDSDSEPAALARALNDVDYVLYAPPVPADLLDVAEAYQLFHQARRLATAMIANGSPAKLLIATRNAQPIAEGDPANPSHGVLWGLGRTITLEHPEIWGAIIDFDNSVPAQVVARQVLDEADATDSEDQVVYRSGVRHVPRLRRHSLAAQPVALDAGASQLVIGATGNIGPHLINQLAEMGAKTIVAVSRNPGQRLQKLAESLAAEGVNLVIAAADATDEAAMTALFDRFGADLPPLEGIYLAAFAGQPVLLTEMTNDDVTAMFAPKLDAAALLHRLSLKVPVRHFVLFSSISGLIGSRWLAHYTATSGYLDALAYARRVMGLPAATVNWGLWKSLADAEHDASQVSLGSGLVPMQDDVAIGALPLVMSQAAGVHSVVVAADWPLLAAAYRTRGSLRIVDDVLPVSDETTVLESEFRVALRNCAPERRHDMLHDQVAMLAANVMGLHAGESLDPSTGFFQLGMDSLMSVTLQRALSDSLGEFLPPSVVFDYPTVYSLTDYLATILPELETDDESTADVYDELTEAELLEQLSQRLRGT